MPSQALEAQERRQLFLEALAETLTFTGAAKVAGVSITRAYQWMDADPNFKQAAEETRQRGKDVITGKLEDAMIQRALKPDGTLSGIFMLKALRPDTYRDNAPQQQPSQTQYVINIVDRRSQLLGEQPTDLVSVVQSVAPSVPALQDDDDRATSVFIDRHAREKESPSSDSAPQEG